MPDCSIDDIIKTTSDILRGKLSYHGAESSTDNLLEKWKKNYIECELGLESAFSHHVVVYIWTHELYVQNSTTNSCEHNNFRITYLLLFVIYFYKCVLDYVETFKNVN